MKKKSIQRASGFLVVAAAAMVGFQNCSQVAFQTVEAPVAKMCVQAASPELEPVEKFRWDHAAATFPTYNQVMSAPMVGDLDGDQKPEIVFSTFTQSQYRGAPGVLRVIRGDNGAEVFSVGGDLLGSYQSSPVIIDIDRDGRSEVVYMQWKGDRAIALNSDGSVRWEVVLPYAIANCWGGMAAADLNGDGVSEIIVENIIIEEVAGVGRVRNTVGPNNNSYCSSFAISTDPQQPSKLQVVTSTGVYEADGTAVYTLPVFGGRVGAADIEKSSEGLELVSVVGGMVRVYNILSKTLLWEKALPSSPDRYNNSAGNGGPPTLADFNGDGETDIAIAGAVYYTVFDNKGNVMWSKETNDHSSNITGSSNFDFNGDGVSEVIYADEGFLRIYEGPTGRVLFSIPNPSHTLTEYPVVADVDNDGHSELVVVMNDHYVAASRWATPDDLAAIKTAGTGLRVFRSKGDNAWVPTRPIWNQFAYFVSNVTDRLTAVSSTPLVGQAQSFFRQNKLNVFDGKTCQ